MPSKLASTASWPQISRPVVQQGQTSSPLCPRPWAVLMRTPSTQFGPSAVPSPTGLAPLTLPSLRGIYLAGLLLPCGVAMPVCGCTAIQLSPVSGRGSLAVSLISCTFCSCYLLLLAKIYIFFNEKKMEKNFFMNIAIRNHQITLQTTINYTHVSFSLLAALL